jgi:hypothetical protein
MSLDSLMESAGTLYRKSTVKSAGGGQTPTWTAVGSETACDLQPNSASIRVQYGQRHLETTFVAFFASDIGARETDRFLVGSRKFVVLGWQPPQGRDEWPGVLDLKEEP